MSLAWLKSVKGLKKGDNRMNKIMMSVMLIALICITMVAPAMAQPSTPFVINGDVSDSDSSLCNDPAILVTNTNTSASWDAENDSESNYYELVLDSDDVSAGNILQIEASGCSETKMVEHTVTQSEMEDGGMFDFDIVFYVESMPDLTVTATGTPVRLRADVINPISATVENIGSENAASFVVTFEASGSIVDTATITSLNAGESTTVEFLWTPSYAGEYTLNVTADANGEVIESDEANNSRIAIETVLDMLTATVNVRIEGMDEMVWCGDVTFSNSTVMTTDGAIHYLNEPTALGALDEADKLGEFGYVLTDYGWGLYVEEVAGEPPIGWDGWVYRVNYVSPTVGASDYMLADNDEVLWYFGKMWPLVPPLKIELDRTTVITGEEFTTTVRAYNDTSMAFEPVDGADVYINGMLHGLTDPDGTLTISLEAPGTYQVHADKGTWANYTRSEKKAVNVATSALKVDIGDYVVTEGSTVTAPITVYGIEDYGTTTLSIEYDSSVAWVTSVDGTPNSTVSSSNTNNPAGILTLSAWNTDGVSGDVVIAYVTFEARGYSGSSTPLNLSVPLMKDTSYNNVPTWDEDGSFTVMEDVMPVVGSPQSSPGTILNDNGRARVPGTNLSTLSVSVTDNAGIASVTIDLSPIGGDAAQPMTPAGGTIWSVVVNATTGINENHYLGVNATDTSGNSNTGVSVPLTVLRRGDVVRDNEVDILDAYYIARYSVGLESAPDQFVADVAPADQWDGVDIVDAFYIARYDVGLEDAP